jgi:hypothetical protein
MNPKMAETITQEPEPITQTTPDTVVATDTPSTETATTDETTDAFDSSTFEVEYGLPEGTLKGVTDEESALQAVRDYTDKLLTAGLTVPQQQAAQAITGQTAAKPADSADKKPSGNVELDALRAELVEVKSTIQQFTQAAQQQQIQELQRRIAAEVDRWDSPKYGKGQARNYNQIKAVRELQELVSTHVAGYVATGRNAPAVESVLRQVRVFHDEGFKPGQQKATPAKQAPLGTPGGQAKAAGDGEPRSIHHALMGRG